MRENQPKKYFTWQYERFKKIGKGYRFTLKNNILVRNRLEQEIGNFLITEFNEMEYEPYLFIEGKAYFPDFRYRNVIIEATEWRHPSAVKINALKKKVRDYRKLGYRTIFFIPNTHRNFYKGLNNSVVSALPDLKQLIDALVA